MDSSSWLDVALQVVQRDDGRAAEQMVRACLEARGWICETQRWRCRYGEIDLLLSKGQGPGRPLLVVEVKSRRRRGLDGWGVSSMTASKRRKLARAITCWQAVNPWSAWSAIQVVVALVPLPLRMDCVHWIPIHSLP